MPRQAIVPVELRHPEKVIGNRFTKKQGLYVVPTAFFCYGLFNLRTDRFFTLFVPPDLAIKLRIILAGFITVLLLGTALALAFVPAYMIPWFRNPKPLRPADPYDVPQMIDSYLVMKFHNKHKEKILPWRGGRTL